MFTSESVIPLDRPSRYLTQLCKHAAAMGATGGGHRPRNHAVSGALARGELQVTATCTDTHGVITIAPWGQATLTAGDSALTVRVQATDADALARIQRILTRDLERFGRRDQLTVAWTAPDTDAQGDPVVPVRSQRKSKILLAAAIAVAVAVHLGVGAAVLPNRRWTGLTLDILIAVIAAKLLIVALARRAASTKHSGQLPAHPHIGRRPSRSHTGGSASDDQA